MESNRDTLSHYQLFDYKARCAVVVCTEVLREAQRRHQLDPLVTIALGRALAGAALLASNLKQGKEYVHCTFAGSGFLKRVLAECNGDGECRGYATPPRLVDVLPPRGAVPESVGGALGATGVLTVTRGTLGERTPYRAVSQFENGEIATDIARYLTESEQIPSAVAAGVKLSPQGAVLAAGGVLVQRLGGADLPEAMRSQLEIKMATQLGLSDRIARGESADAIAAFLVGPGQPWGVLTARTLRFACSCTRDRMSQALYSLGEEQLRAILRDIGRIEVRCHYCSTAHEFRIEELTRQ